ncbi:MFS transporter [Streptomyces amakusaensis]|uniref:MFS transporter n=1 Tax=Streptomyces amakusaensis TaxID=67271 RepID=A0ABW0AW41_9ACTN
MTTKTTSGSVGATGTTKRGNRWWGLVVVSLAQLMVFLDATIVAVALPSAQEAVGLTDVSRQWTVSAYAITFGGLLLLGGRIGDIIGVKRALMIGVIGFAIASAVGGAATTPGMLIGSRAGQGVFAALIAPSTLSLISSTFTDAAERTKAFGVFAAISMSGGAVGLILGGVLTDYLDWRWCFYINILFAAVIVIGGLLALPAPTSGTDAKLDIPGAVLATGGILGLIYGLGEGGILGWGSPSIVGSLIAAVVLLTAFVVVQTKAERPLLPLRVITNRNSGGAFLAMAISAFCMLGMFLGMTYQLQTVMNYSPLKTGLAFLAYIVTAAVYSTQVASRLLLRMRPHVMITAGLVVSALGLLLLTRLTPESDYLTGVFPALFLFGIGVGNLAVPIFQTAMSATEARDAGIVSAVVNTSQQVGGSIGAALLNTISTSAAAAHLGSSAVSAEATQEASVHGLAVACGVAAVVALAGAVATGLLINIRPGKTAGAGAEQK